MVTLSYLIREQDVISKQGGNFSQKSKQTGCNKQTGWGKLSQVVKQTGCFKQAKTGKTTPKPYFKVKDTWYRQ